MTHIWMGYDFNVLYISEFIGLNVVSSIHPVIKQVCKMGTRNDQRLNSQLNRPRFPGSISSNSQTNTRSQSNYTSLQPVTL